MVPVIFSMTAIEADDSDLPLRMRHGRDLGTRDAAGGVDYDYNFIDYVFAHAGGQAGARLYLDTPGHVSVMLGRAALGAPAAAAILLYLQRRFHHIHTLEAGKGYELSWVDADWAERG